jgi:prepilin-type N-terminal cleavage/methylation domain-containing protein/prepilin-type processing-associated H-X9-DG protein
MKSSNSFTANSFTLIELLVVIAIIAILASMLLPSLAKAREHSKGIKCVSNIKQAITAQLLYSNDFKGCFIDQRVGSEPWVRIITDELKYTTRPTLSCPSMPFDTAKNLKGQYNNIYFNSYGMYRCRWYDKAESVTRANFGDGVGVWVLDGETELFSGIKTSQLKNVAEFVVFADNSSVSGDKLVQNYLFAPKRNIVLGMQSCHVRHNNKATLAYADGHAGTSGIDAMSQSRMQIKHFYDKNGVSVIRN